MTPFEKIASDLDELAQAPARAALRAAPDLLEVVKTEFAHGQLRGLIVKTTARAEGSAIVLDFDDRLPIAALHADPLPAAWEKPIADALAEEAP